MAMPVQYLNEINRLGKNVYSKERIENLQNQEAATFSKLKKSSTPLQGNGYYGSALSQGNQAGQGSYNEFEALRTPDRQQVEQWLVRPKEFAHTILISGLSIEMLKNGPAAFADGFTFQMDKGLEDSAKELNQQVFRPGTGVKALVNGAVIADTAIIYDNGIPTHFAPGELIDVYTAGGVLEAQNAEIVANDLATQTLTVAANVTLSDNSEIFRAGIRLNRPADGKEMAGLPRMVDDGTNFGAYQGIVRVGGGAVDAWRGLTLNAGGANLSDDMLQRAMFRVKTYSNQSVDTIISNSQQMRRYMAITLPSVQFTEGAKRDTAPAKDREWNGIKWIFDTDAPFDGVYMYSSKCFMRFETKGLGFDNIDGSIIKHFPGFDAFIAYAKYYGNLGSNNPRAGILIDNLSVLAL